MQSIEMNWVKDLKHWLFLSFPFKASTNNKLKEAGGWKQRFPFAVYHICLL